MKKSTKKSIMIIVFILCVILSVVATNQWAGGEKLEIGAYLVSILIHIICPMTITYFIIYKPKVA